MCGGGTSCEKKNKKLFSYGISPHKAPETILGRIMAPNGKKWTLKLLPEERVQKSCTDFCVQNPRKKHVHKNKYSCTDIVLPGIYWGKSALPKFFLTHKTRAQKLLFSFFLRLFCSCFFNFHAHFYAQLFSQLNFSLICKKLMHKYKTHGQPNISEGVHSQFEFWK